MFGFTAIRRDRKKSYRGQNDSPFPEGTRHIQDPEGNAGPQNYGSSGHEMRV